MRVAVTGGTGFIGRYLLRELLGQGYEVNAWFRHEESRSGILEHPKLHWVKAQFGNAGSQLELGKSMVESRPREALKWLKLAAAAKEKGAAATAKQLARTLSKKEIDQVQAAVKAFNPLK